MNDAVVRALDIGPDSATAAYTIDIAARVTRRQNLDEWLARSPLVEIVFDDMSRRPSCKRT